MIAIYKDYDTFQLHSLPTGQYLAPVNCLVEPNKSDLIRAPDRKFVDLLRIETLQNPVKAVAPFQVLVHLEEWQHAF